MYVLLQAVDCNTGRAWQRARPAPGIQDVVAQLKQPGTAEQRQRRVVFTFSYRQMIVANLDIRFIFFDAGILVVAIMSLSYAPAVSAAFWRCARPVRGSGRFRRAV